MTYIVCRRSTEETCPLWCHHMTDRLLKKAPMPIFLSFLLLSISSNSPQSYPLSLLAASGRVRGQRGHVLSATSPCVLESCCWLLSNSGNPLIAPQQRVWASSDQTAAILLLLVLLLLLLFLFLLLLSTASLLPSTLPDITSSRGGWASLLLVLSEKQLRHRRFFEDILSHDFCIDILMEITLWQFDHKTQNKHQLFWNLLRKLIDLSPWHQVI